MKMLYFWPVANPTRDNSRIWLSLSLKNVEQVDFVFVNKTSTEK